MRVDPPRALSAHRSRVYESNRVRPLTYARGSDHMPLVKRYSQIESDVQSTRE